MEEKKKQGEKSKTGTKREKETENHFRSHIASFIWDIVVTCLSSILMFSLCLFSSIDHFIGNLILIGCLDAELHESLFPLLELHECNQIQIMLLCLGIPGPSFPGELSSFTEETLETDRATLWVGG